MVITKNMDTIDKLRSVGVSIKLLIAEEKRYMRWRADHVELLVLIPDSWGRYLFEHWVKRED